jgi:hypothetical protein
VTPDFDPGFSHDGTDDMERRLAYRKMDHKPSWWPSKE